MIDDLWALALAHLPQLREYERAVNQRAHLTGRNLESWRALLAVALWLDDHDAQGILHRTTSSDPVSDPTAPAPAPVPGGAGPRTALWDRMETLSIRYQCERSDLETDDLTALVIHALCGCAINAISAINTETPSHFVFTVQDILLFAQAVAKMKDGDPDHITHRRVGRVLGRMRLPRAPRSGGRGSRCWRVTLGDLARWTAAYGISFPAPLAALLAANDANDPHGDVASVA